MKYETAVSEILGAVFLIGIVIIAFSIIGVYLLTTTPSSSSKVPISTIGSHCVRCSEGNYEIYATHQGGEPMQQNDMSFTVTNKDGASYPITPSGVYNSIPTECSGSGLDIEYGWNGLNSYVSGQVIKFDYNSNYYGDSPPESLVIKIDENIVDTLSYETIKDKTEILNTGDITPVLKSVATSDYGFCEATFYYNNTLGTPIEILPCDLSANVVIVDGDGKLLSGTECPMPWNEFIGIGTGDFSFLKRDMGQSKNFVKNEDSDISKREFTIKFKNWIQWKLGKSSSKIAKCDAVQCSCGSSETCVWGYMYVDSNNNGVKDAGEPGFEQGKVKLTGSYKNNKNNPEFIDQYTPSQTGGWKSRCIQMSGWAYDIEAILPEGYTTKDSYIDYDNKMTGQDKKNPPEVNFGVVAESTEVPPTPSVTPTEVPTVIPVPTSGIGSGVGAQLYATDSTTDVIVEFAYSSAGYKNEFKLAAPRDISLGWSQGEMPDHREGTPIGTTWNLGKFSVNQELKFSDTANGRTYYTGPASRNPDNLVHGAVSLKNSDGTDRKYLVSFEDWYGMTNSDRDFNDIEYYVSGNLATSPITTPTPTPAPTTAPPSDKIKPTVDSISVTQVSEYHPVVIKWRASDNVGVVRMTIRLSTDGGSSYPVILYDSPWTTSPSVPKEGSYSWTPVKNHNSAMFEVTAYDGATNPFSGTYGPKSIKKLKY